ncbi:MAG: ATP-dependent sacrificial sulfur transferase LarE [Gemmatimonadetes bacterium]|nr:ATP-dependent sacrificial sulfur transferase LarE [Gemmatimonadota bacterium]
MTPDAPLADPALALHKEGQLIAQLQQRGSILVGFSGGVDSVYLAAVAVEAVGAENTLAVIGRSPSYPAVQWEAARAVATQLAVPCLEVDTHELDDPRYAANPTNRCFFCKTELWSVLVPIAAARGLAVVADGSNADDRTDFRPGAQAARDHGVWSPLSDAGLTKAEIRQRSAARGLPTANQPASPCLSSRLPYHIAVTTERLAQVERAEAALRALGITGDLRVRHHGDLARVELGRDQLALWLAPGAAARIAAALREAGYSRVTIDLRGFRSGSLNVLEGVGA